VVHHTKQIILSDWIHGSAVLYMCTEAVVSSVKRKVSLWTLNVFTIFKRNSDSDFLSAKFPYMTWSAKCGRQSKWLSSCYKSTDMDSTSHFPKLGHVQHYFSLPCMHVFFSQGMHACEGRMHLFSRICMRSVGVSLSSQ